MKQIILLTSISSWYNEYPELFWIFGGILFVIFLIWLCTYLNEALSTETEYRGKIIEKRHGADTRETNTGVGVGISGNGQPVTTLTTFETGHSETHSFIVQCADGDFVEVQTDLNTFYKNKAGDEIKFWLVVPFFTRKSFYYST